MLTSEELFPLEYCFDGSCSSHLARSIRPPLYPLRICTPYTLRVVFHLSVVPLPLPPAPFTRRHCFNETGNVQFVRPAPSPVVKRAAFGRYTLPCTLALSLFSRLSCRARKIRPTLSAAARSYARASALHHRASVSHVLWSVILA